MLTLDDGVISQFQSKILPELEKIALIDRDLPFDKKG